MLRQGGEAQIVGEVRRQRRRRRPQAQDVAFAGVDRRGLERMEARHAVCGGLEHLFELQRGSELLADLEQSRQPAIAMPQTYTLGLLALRTAATQGRAL